jgi:guanyl-specific ribonuclease Sa
MNRRLAATLVFSFLATLATAVAQSPTPNTSPSTSAVAPSQEGTNPPVSANRDEAMDADARHCLELPTNLQIIVCAEKYLPHKRRA